MRVQIHFVISNLNVDVFCHSHQVQNCTFKPSNVSQETRRKRQSAAAPAPATGPDLEALDLKAELRRRMCTRQTLIRAGCSAQTCANGRSPVGIALYFTAAEARHTLNQPNLRTASNSWWRNRGPPILEAQGMWARGAGKREKQQDKV